MSFFGNILNSIHFFEPQKPTQEPPKADDARRPYPQFNSFRSFVINELMRRKRNYPTAIKSPFVRFTSCKQDTTQKYAFFSMGLHGFKKEDLNIFDQTYGTNRDIVGYAHELGNGNKKLISADQLTAAALPPIITNEMTGAAAGIQKQRDALKKQSSDIFAKGTHPIPGVTNIQLQRRGLGTPLIATVQWTCYNRAQLEFLRHHFMTAGGYVVLEWGQNFSDGTQHKLLNFSDIDGTKNELATCINKGRSHIIQNWIKPNNGNYDFMVGYVGNFTVQLDPQTNIYTCSTTIYSVGEQMWGLSSFLTTVNKEDPDTSNNSRKSTNFHEFFAYGKEYDNLMNNSSDKHEFVAPYRASWNKTGTDKVAVNGTVANGEDYRFVSWAFFVEVVLPQLLSILDDAGVKEDLKKFLDFAQGNEDAWVGDNPELKSTDPETLILVRSNITSDPAFAGIGNFDGPDGRGYRGKLTQGVWINAAAIRESFKGTNSFQQAMYTLLSRMNRAVADYWKLQMFYDEETHTYKIVDEGHIDNANFPTLYKFNHGTEGELLNISFDSAFPPELITQMALFAKFKTEKYEDQQKLLAKYPSIGTTSTFMFSLNWTNLEDILDTELQRRRTIAPASPVAPVDQTIKAAPEKKDTPTASPASQKLVPVSGNTQGMFTQVSNLAAGNPSNSPFVNPPTMVTRASVAAVPNATVIQLATKMAAFKTAIDTAAAKHHVDPDLIRAVISRENPDLKVNAEREERHINDKSVGLMQLLTSTASGLAGRRVEAAELYDPAFNIDLGTKYLAENIAGHRGEVEAGVSAYNNGSGMRAPKDTAGYVIQHEPRVTIDVRAGQFYNYPYVDSVMKRYAMFRALSLKPPIDSAVIPPVALPTPQAVPNPVPTTPVVVSAVTGAPIPQSTSTDEKAEQDAKANDIKNRFGDVLVRYIELSPSAMTGRITRNGHINYPRFPNSFVCPFPTTTSITLELVGIGGISVSDGFFVDKLPYIFEQYGCFQVTSVDEVVSPEGWTTRISGYFKLVWMNGEGPAPIPVG
jgi:soluble lytic murein transglycosylase-like protein